MAVKIQRHKYKINSSETLFVKDLHSFCRIKGSPPPIIFERLKLPQQIICLREENLSESSNHLKYRYCNRVRSFISQVHKYPKQSTTYGRENSIALLHFTVINQNSVLQRNAGFICQPLKTPKMNLTGISLQNVAFSISN